jgi:hypothetical protein
MSEAEAERFMKFVEKSGLSREVYMRFLMNGLVPTDMPPPDYFAMMRQLHHIGNNMNLIVQKAHVLNVVDAQKYDEAYAHYKNAIITITEAVMLPRKIEIWLPPPSGL